MIPPFQPDGNLPPGIHTATWEEVVHRFGGNPRRQRLLAGLAIAVANLQDAGCRRIYLNGSFVTSKPFPDDFDAVWESEGVDFTRVAPLLLDRRDLLNHARRQQKRVYGGELIPDLFLGSIPSHFSKRMMPDSPKASSSSIWEETTMKETGLETEQQYENTRKWVERFNAILEQEAKNGPPAGERDRMAWESGLTGWGGVRNTLLAQMRDYESRRDRAAAA